MKTETQMLDATLLEPRVKHPVIFQFFERLLPGQSFILRNDHDPKPLYYQMIGELGNVVGWEYLEQGPEWWQVRITRLSESSEGGKTVGEIAASDLRKAQVFKKYGIDFCCGGKKTLKEACESKGLNPAEIEKELNATTGPAPLPFKEWSPAFLADYIVNTHHAYVRKMLPEITQLMAKVLNAHGERHPELAQVSYLVQRLDDELLGHLAKEEKVVFPYIRELVQGDGPSRFSTIETPIAMMEDEHDEAGGIMEKIRDLTNDYTLPPDSCVSYGLLFQMLKDFEDDLHTHVHLENNILFPRALELDKERTGTVGRA
ncbi:MAG: iron-sulfur cluster repair di-iron protein [Cyclobacteriaceae bacterium]|jgi:regulator of cell morphogenesis and NO signaling|nr:iron-sulfur cluster repair di-iron protein [Cyclobacteriaceae bacterium]